MYLFIENLITKTIEEIISTPSHRIYIEKKYGSKQAILLNVHISK